MFTKIVNNGWSLSTTLGNGLLIVLIAYLVVDIIKNKQMNIIQLFGKEFMVIMAILIIWLRMNFNITF